MDPATINLSFNFFLISNTRKAIDIKMLNKANCRIKSDSQKDFFRGYCRAWSLYFQAILSSAPQNFDAIKYLAYFIIA
jgi:hypothetical protein